MPNGASRVVTRRPGRRVRDVEIPSREQILDHLREQGVPSLAADVAPRAARSRRRRERSLSGTPRRDGARRSADDQPQGATVRRRQARSRHGHRARPPRRFRLPRTGRRFGAICSCRRRKCTRRCTAIAPPRVRSASTSAADLKASSSMCWSASIAKWSGACTRITASGIWSPRTSASARTYSFRRTCAARPSRVRSSSPSSSSSLRCSAKRWRGLRRCSAITPIQAWRSRSRCASTICRISFRPRRNARRRGCRPPCRLPIARTARI